MDRETTKRSVVVYLLSPVLLLLSPVLHCTGTSTGPGIQCTGRHTVADDATATATDSLDDDDDLMEERIGALFRFLLANESSRHVWPGLKFIGCPMGCDDDATMMWKIVVSLVSLLYFYSRYTNTVCHHSSFNLSYRTPRTVSSMKRIVRMMITGTTAKWDFQLNWGLSMGNRR